MSDGPRHDRVFMNLLSGRYPTIAEHLRSYFEGHSIVAYAPEYLPGRVQEALATPVAVIGIAGGDGTIRCGTQPLIRIRWE